MKNERHIHMIGIGGIGMSALAQLYFSRGVIVTGSDRSPSVVTDLLSKKGIVVHIGHDEQIPEGATHIVYSDAVPPENAERVAARTLRIPEQSYFQALGEVSSHMDTIAVSGTHGKTTTTAMLTKILKDAGKDPTAVIGSLVKDFGGNFVGGKSNALIVEACEYRDHLLELTPRILVITNVEWDHTDWFHSEDAMVETFKKAVSRVPHDGFIVANPRSANIARVLAGASASVIDYSREKIPPLNLIGSFNMQNAQAAKAAAKSFAPDLLEEQIDIPLTSFQGSWRRFEKKGIMSRSGALVYDDYAHHPTAVRETILGIREKFSERRLMLIFHPHLYTRTRDLFDDFASALSLADDVVIAPIFAAREEPIPGVTSDSLAKAVAKNNTHVRSLPNFSAIEQYVREHVRENTLVVTMGAGDIYKVADALVAH
jgi:UDP-N-acetylmuramate--alanine ligase